MLYMLTAEETVNVTVRQAPVSILRERENDATETLSLPRQNIFYQKANRRGSGMRELYNPRRSSMIGTAYACKVCAWASTERAIGMNGAGTGSGRSTRAVST